MNDFEGLLSTNYGFKTSRNSPMSSSKPSNSNPTPFKPPYDNDALSRPNSSKNASDFSSLGGFDDVFKPSSNSGSSVNFDAIFGGGGGGGRGGDSPASRFSSLPVFDKPVYDDDVSSLRNNYEDLFSSNSAKKSGRGGGGGGSGSDGDDAFGDLLGVLGRTETKSTAAEAKSGDKGGVSDFDDLLPGFGGSASISRSSSDKTKKPSSVLDDPFVVLESSSPVSSTSGVFNDPLEEIGNLNISGRKKVEDPSSRVVFDDTDPLDDFAKSVPPFSTESNGREKEESPLRTGPRVSRRQTSANADVGLRSSASSPERGSEKKMSVGDIRESPHSVFEMPSMSVGSNKSAPNASSPVYGNPSSAESYSRGEPEENTGSSDDVWLTVSEIPLFTQPTAAPPPSRPPPPRPTRFSIGEYGSFPASNAHRRADDYSSLHSSNPFQSPKSAPAGAKGSFASPVDELEEFAMGTNRSDMDESSDVHSGEDFDSNSVAAASAAAMKEAMDRAEVKFRYARGVREREHAKASRSRESVQVDKEVETAQDRDFREGQERLERDRAQREREEEGRRREEEERRRIEKEQEVKEKEKRRIERERELARQAVERASKEARERAALEARTRADRAAVQRAQAEARERAARAAVQRAQAEARERAAADAKERAEKAAEEAKARAEAREREARERASAARGNQQKTEPDLDSIFGAGSRASSAPRPRANSSDTFETQFQSRPAPDATRTSVNSASTMRKASSSTNIVDDLSSIFGGPPSSSSSGFGVFQEVEGETEDRRRARVDREQRTKERTAKALAEKNARDLEAQREQAERHRIAETLDIEIKRWAAGKEGNLRALLSTMQYVLWPECGWQPVSLTDLITGAAVKKVYRKATLCIHPDKVQQKGATLQQKYVAEKVFDLLKEAWNKFNSEELF